jgi:phage-related protein
MAKSGIASVEVVADFRRFSAQFQRDLNKALRGIRLDMSGISNQISRGVREGVDSANAEFSRLGDQANDAFGRVGDDSDRLGRRMSTIGNALGTTGKALGKFALWTTVIGGAGAAAGAATGQLLGLAGVLVQASGASLLLPAAIGTGIAAMGAMKLATAGFGDVLKAAAEGDLAKFDKAVEGLSPVAQTLAAELRAVIPVMSEMRNASQNAFSTQLLGQITATSAALSGPLTVGLAGIAAEWGVAARRVAEFARESATVSALSQVMGAAKASIAGVSVGLQPLLAGFRDLTVVGLPVITSISQVAGDLATKFGTWLSSMAASGQATAAIETALGILSNLATIAGAVGGILQSVFSAAAQSSGGLLGSLTVLLTTLNRFLSSAEGQTALTSLFTTLNTLASGLSPVFGALINIVAGLIPAFGDVALAIVPALQMIAGGLAPAIKALQPAISVVASALSAGLQALAPALLPIGQAIAALAIAVAPLLPVLGRMIAMLIGPLASAIAAIAPMLGPLITALGPVLMQIASSLMSAIGPVIGFLIQLFTALGPSLGQIVTTLATTLAPLLVQLAPILTSVLNGFLPLLPAIVALVGPLLQIIVAVTPLLLVMAQLAGVILTMLGPTIQFTALWLKVLAINVISPILTGIAKALEWLMSPLSSVLGWLVKLGDWVAKLDWSSVATSIRGGIGAAFQWLAGIAGTVWNALVTAFNAIGAAASWLWNTVLSPVFKGIAAGIGAVIAVGMWFWNTFGPIWLAIGSLIWAVWSAVFSVVFGLIKMAISGVVAVFTWWWQVFSSVWTAIGSLIMAVYAGFIQPIINAIGAVFTWLWNNAISPALSAVGAAISWIGGFISGIFSGIGAVLTWLGNFFSKIWDGIVGFVMGAVSRIVATATQIYAWVSGVGSAFQAAKDAIVEKINSAVEFVRGLPGKILGAIGNMGSLLYNAGQNVINGLISGLNDRIGALRAKISEAAGAIRDALPFSPAKEGPLSGRGDPTISGGKIVAMVAEGMKAEIPSLRAAAWGLADAAMAMSPTMFGALANQPAFTAPTGALTGALAGTRGADTGGGGNTYNLTVNALDPKSAAEAVIEAIADWERRNGKDWRS